MTVRGLYQQAMDFIDPLINTTFPDLPKTWLSDKEAISYKKEGAYPFVEIKVPTRNEFVMRPFTTGPHLASIQGLGYVSFQFEISIVGQSSAKSIVWQDADNWLTTLLLNLPHDKPCFDYLGYNKNFVVIDSYGYEEVERDEDSFQLTKYTAVISYNQFLGKRIEHTTTTIRDFKCKIDMKTPVLEEKNDGQ